MEKKKEHHEKGMRAQVETDEETERLLAHGRTLHVDFSGAHMKILEAKTLFEKEEYDKAITAAKKAMDLQEESSENFRKLGTSYIITSSHHLLNSLKKLGSDTAEAERILDDLKNAYKEGDYERSKVLIENLWTIEGELQQRRAELIAHEITLTQSLMEEMKNIGFDTTELENAFKLAIRAHEESEHHKTLDLLKEIGESGLNLLGMAISATQSLINEVKELGVDVTEPAKIFADANSAYEQKDLMNCMKFLKESGHLAVELRERHIRARKAKEIFQTYMREKVAAPPAAPPAHARKPAVRPVPPPPAAPTSTPPQPVKKPMHGVCSQCRSKNLLFFDDGSGRCQGCGRTFWWKK